MLQIIVINGVAENGKDSFVKYCDGFFPGMVFNHSTVSTVKEAAKLFGADEAVCKGEAERRLWSDMKDAYTRYCDGPFKEIVERIDILDRAYGQTSNSLIFLHIREPGEIKKVKDKYPDRCVVILVSNENLEHVPENHADQNVRNYNYDKLIQNNDSLDDLKNEARIFVEDILKKMPEILCN